MNCKRAEYLIAGLVSGIIEERDKHLLRAHIEQCDACHAVYKTQSAIEKQLRGMASAAPGSEFAKRVAGLAAATQQTRPKPRLRSVFTLVTPVSAVSVTCALVILGIWIAFDGAFIDWIKNVFTFPVEGISTNFGFFISIVLGVGIVTLITLGLYKAVRDL